MKVRLQLHHRNLDRLKTLWHPSDHERKDATRSLVYNLFTPLRTHDRDSIAFLTAVSLFEGS